MNNDHIQEQESSFSDKTFQSLGLKDTVLQGIDDAGFINPTEIQAQLIPEIIKGFDVIGQARTGTGKTATFALPLLHLCDPNISSQALILVPTRELASQITSEINSLGKHTGNTALCIVGGESMKKQTDGMNEGAQIIVGTPGRIMDMIGRKLLKLKNMKFAVLDEVDRMFDIGFRDEIRKILKMLKGDQQTIFVSATMNEEIERLARANMKDDAKKIITVSGALTVDLVDQKYLPVQAWDKPALLLHMLQNEKPDTTVVFCKTKATVRKLTEKLKRKNFNVCEIHGDLAQKKRSSVMQSLRDRKVDIMIASDLAARGLDVEHVTHVINYDLPEDPEVYVHRIGRTARAGKKGVAWTYVSPEQGQLLTEVEKLTGCLIEKLDYPNFKPGPVPAARQKEIDAAKKPDITSQADKLSKRQGAVDIEEQNDAELAAMFPGGIIPKSQPKRNLGSRLRTRRSR